MPGNDEEEDLDVESGAAFAPGANIVVVVVPLSNGDARTAQVVFDAAMQYAATLPGVSVVMSSYGYPPTASRRCKPPSRKDRRNMPERRPTTPTLSLPPGIKA